jgi:hypothetical protein
MRFRLLFAVLIILALCAISPAQDREQDLMPDKPAHNPAVPTITFQFEFPGANPSHYAISVDATGRAAYKSTAPQDDNTAYSTPGQQPAEAPYMVKFTMSQPVRDQVLALAKRLDYFNGNFDYTKTRVANTGAKTLIYADPTRHFEANFNWSQNPDVMELTRIFQNISTTLEFDRRLQDHIRHQKLALEDDLKQLQDAVSHNNAAEVQLLAPTLQKIANNASILHIARRRAQELLATVPK